MGWNANPNKTSWEDQALVIETTARELKTVDSALPEEVSMWLGWSLFSSQRHSGSCCVMVVSTGKSSSAGDPQSLLRESAGS